MSENESIDGALEAPGEVDLEFVGSFEAKVLQADIALDDVFGAMRSAGLAGTPGFAALERARMLLRSALADVEAQPRSLVELVAQVGDTHNELAAARKRNEELSAKVDEVQGAIDRVKVSLEAAEQAEGGLGEA